MSDNKQQDVVVQQKNRLFQEEPSAAKVLENYKAPQRIVPTYLVSVEKAKLYFVAVKFDEASVHCAKFVGFYTEKSMNEIVENYSQIVAETDVSQFMEIQFPWNKIISIRSLIYRHKIAK